MFTGESLPESSWRGSPVRLQTTEIQGNCSLITGVTPQLTLLISDVRMRRLWSHNTGARGSLSPPERKPPLLPGTTQVLRQETFQIQ